MSAHFAETLKRLRIERGLTQRELAERVFVARPTVARWESGNRLPDAAMISRLSQCLGVEVSTLLHAAIESEEAPTVIMVDDNKILLTGGMPVLEHALPHATVAGFTQPAKALEFARANPVALAFLDIEMGKANGLDLARELLEINPHTNVVFLTAYPDYALDAWSTGASGFMVKPITPEGVRAQLRNLRHPFSLGGAQL